MGRFLLVAIATASATTAAAVAATTATIAAATATAAATSATAAAVTTATATAITAAAATGAGSPWASFIDRDIAARNVLPIEILDGVFGAVAFAHFNKRETTTAARFPVHDDVDSRYFTVLLKRCPKIVFGGREREVPYVNIRHKSNLKTVTNETKRLSHPRRYAGKHFQKLSDRGECGA